MKNSFRLISAILAAVLCASFLAGCANEVKPPITDVKTDEPATVETVFTDAITTKPATDAPIATTEIVVTTESPVTTTIGVVGSEGIKDGTSFIPKTAFVPSQPVLTAPFSLDSNGRITSGLDGVSFYSEGYYINLWENNSYNGPGFTEDKGLYFATDSKLDLSALKDNNMWDAENHIITLSEGLSFSIELQGRQVIATSLREGAEPQAYNYDMINLYPGSVQGNTATLFTVSYVKYPAGTSEYAQQVCVYTITMSESLDEVQDIKKTICSFNHNISYCCMNGSNGVIEVVLYTTADGTALYGYYVTDDGGATWQAYCPQPNTHTFTRVNRLLPYSK